MKKYAHLAFYFLLLVTGIIMLAQAPPTTPGTPAPSTNPTSAGSPTSGPKPLTEQQKTETLAQYRKLLLAQIYLSQSFNTYSALTKKELEDNGFPPGSEVKVNSDSDKVIVELPPAHPAPPSATPPVVEKKK